MYSGIYVVLKCAAEKLLFVVNVQSNVAISSLDGSSGLTNAFSSELNSAEEEENPVTGHRYPEEKAG